MSNSSGSAQAAAIQAAGVAARSSGWEKTAGPLMPEFLRPRSPPATRRPTDSDRRGPWQQRAQQPLVSGKLRRNFRQFGPLVLVNDFHCRGAVVGLAADQHFVEHDAQAVKIAARVDDL